MRQHYIPRCYLKRFSDNEKSIHTYDKKHCKKYKDHKDHKDPKIRGRFFDPFLIKGLKYPVRNKSH